MKTSIYLFLAVTTLASVAVAQNKKDKIEIGVHSTSLTLVDPDNPFDETRPGVGGRVTYNFNRWIAAEAEINFFPHKQRFFDDRDAIQGQFGVKLGKRFEKFGLFAKVRPGFLSVDKVLSVEPGATAVDEGITLSDFKFERTTYFTIDAGGVLELYPSKRSVVRFEVGDTAIRHPARFDFAFTQPLSVQLVRPAKFNHNFQFTAGVGFRLGDFPAEDGNLETSIGERERTPRFEVGVQFTSLFVDPPSLICAVPCLVDDFAVHTEPGFGGRFTFNLTENFALEAEGNYYTRHLFEFPNPEGHMFQAQFGAKIGKRLDKWGWFGKIRPGFVGFTRVFELTNTPFPRVTDFRFVKKHYPSIDIGGVVEFYISRRWMARFDIGDTVIRYGEIRSPGFSMSMPIVTRPSETHHNLQVTSGIGFRF